MSVLPVGIGSEEGGYRIERSLRFNSADSAFLNRTPSGAGTSATIWTFSWWQKGVALTGSTQVVFGAESGGARDMIRWDGSGTLEFVKASSTLIRVPTAKYRDPSAWYHFVINVSGATVGVYVNGVQVTAFTTSNNPSGSWYIGQNNLHRIGLDPTGGDALNGYLTEINFIDGQALDPTSFGEFNSDTGVWQPIKYTGTYGTNGFYLNFSDNASTTTLGDDLSGNGNDWTTNNFSVTAGAGNDSLVDSPTRYGTDTGAGGEVRGNYATWNPLGTQIVVYTTSVTNGNLDASYNAATNVARINGTFAASSGKWYFEFQSTAGDPMIGVATTDGANAYVYDGNAANKRNYAPITSGSPSSSAYGATWTTTDIIGVALDLDAGTLEFYKNNVSQGTAYSSLSGTFTPTFGYQGGTTVSGTANFGQRPFAYTAPSGFLSICTTNLPTPTIADGGEYFDVVTRTFTGATASVTSLDFAPDLLWFKRRDGAASHSLYDKLRGTNSRLLSNGTNAEITTTSAELTSFDNNGFTVGADSGQISINGPSGGTGVVWAWKANGAGVSNTAGTITSTVSVNTTSGFSIVTYTGTGSAGTVGHGLGVAPAMVIVKKRSATGNWVTWHTGLTGSNPEDRLIYLDLTNAQTAVTDYWGTAGMTSTTFGVWASGGDNNASGSTFVAYCFAPVPGFSSMGSYVGNGSTDGPMIFTGFRPAFILIKRTDASGDDWSIYDNKRPGYNITQDLLNPNTSAAETTGGNRGGDFVSNGFKIRTTGGNYNASGGTFIYMAFAENPFAYSLAR